MDEDKAVTVRRVFELRDTMPNASLQKIANTLNAEDHTTKEGKQFYPMQVKTYWIDEQSMKGVIGIRVSNLKDNVRRFYHGWD